MINVSQVTLDREIINELGNDSWILSIRDTIVQCELFIMRVLHFDPSVKLPHPVSFVQFFTNQKLQVFLLVSVQLFEYLRELVGRRNY